MNLQEYNLRVGDVAYQLKVTPMTVIRWADKGDLYCVKVGASRRFRQEDIDDFLKSKQNPQKPKEPEPVYNGPPAEECGFGDDIDAWKTEMRELRAKATAEIEADRAMKASLVKVPEPVSNITNKYYRGPFPSELAELLDVYDDDYDGEKEE
ncbi:helix-turn-helix domain-containing protein [Clostridium sp. OS1-26]|uniref:helix-turn-helix domain-containing protein n=1 Tax=Clostridium sp. OS1-26 TaxID=3070681 RepID=UPI0027DFEAAA|nr:helix-turn-helix domain-containing protein [Clostridium sp. OS1-26]WML36949.1 helix-turn-helix domain-containing protein [Clostridium sp. OS1-26]